VGVGHDLSLLQARCCHRSADDVIKIGFAVNQPCFRSRSRCENTPVSQRFDHFRRRKCIAPGDDHGNKACVHVVDHVLNQFALVLAHVAKGIAHILEIA